jgi:hypothetical protein
MVALGLRWRPAAQAAMTMGPGEDKRDARHVSGGSQALSVKERRGSYHMAGGEMAAQRGTASDKPTKGHLAANS